MKAILGVDLGGTSQKAEEVLRRLAFPDLHVEAVAGVEAVLPDMSWPSLSADHPIALALKQREEAADEALDGAESRLSVKGIQVTKTRDYGDPARLLTQRAEESHADLIAAGSERKGRFGSLFLGSVTKGLCIEAKTNVLIGKQEIPAGDSVTAVFATDLSEYSLKCVDELVRLAPRGIEKIVVLVAFGIDEGIRTYLVPEDASLAAYTPQAVEARLRKEAEEVAEKLRSVCAHVETLVVENDINHSIRDAMKAHSAELLILGAQGKNFLKRIALGSTAMHQVINGDDNLLLLRPQVQ